MLLGQLDELQRGGVFLFSQGGAASFVLFHISVVNGLVLF